MRLGKKVAVLFIKCMIAAGIFCIIISKFNYELEFGLIILLQIDEDSEVSLYSDIFSFSLAISLQIKGG